MRILFKIIVIFGLFVALVSVFTGCKSEIAGEVDGSGYPPAPELIANASVKLTDGGNFRLADKKGKVVLINLWATWCGPCRREMPELVKMQEKFRDQGFEVIGLDVDPEPKPLVEKFAEKMEVNYTLGWAPEEMVRGFFDITQRNGIPQSFLFNRNGELTGVFFGGSTNVIEKMKETVEKIVAEE